MNNTATDEKAYKLSPGMVESLQQLNVCHPVPHFVPNTKTAIAMLNRGWIEKAHMGEKIHTRSLYTITRAGALALKIGQRE